MQKYEHIIKYLPRIEDRMAVSIIQNLMYDVKQLEKQLVKQEERVQAFHSNLQRYADEVINKIVIAETNC